MTKPRSVGNILREFDRYGAKLATQFTDQESVRPVRAVMVEKRGECELSVGDTLIFSHPGQDLPAVCPGLMNALRPFIVAEALAITTAESDGYLVSCQSQKGTVWRVKAGE